MGGGEGWVGGGGGGVVDVHISHTYLRAEVNLLIIKYLASARLQIRLLDSTRMGSN